MTERSLGWLTARAMRGFRKLSGNLRERIIDIAATRLPDAAKKLTEATLHDCGFAPQEADFIAKSVRWAAVIRRDHGEEAFWQFIAQVRSTE